MKWKYQLRGLGFGIIISALIMGIFNHSKEMTDEEIKQKARELGMSETVALGDLVTPESTIEIVVKEPDSSSETSEGAESESTEEAVETSTEDMPESSEAESSEAESSEVESSEVESSEVESSEVENS